ncbi:MAG: hypothetical protein ABSA52_18720 [Candidatus Binatia bacterium]|jgi:hypothetical protein
MADNLVCVKMDTKKVEMQGKMIGTVQDLQVFPLAHQLVLSIHTT